MNIPRKKNPSPLLFQMACGYWLHRQYVAAKLGNADAWPSIAGRASFI
jgi:hypothetical protein